MKNKLQAFRFWLSAIIFERYLKHPSAQEIGERIEKECSEYNSKHWRRRCRHCGGSDLITKISGSDGDGLFFYISPHHSYECKKCGNQQSDDGSHIRHAYKELREFRVIEDGADHYHYQLFTEKNGNQVFAGFIIAFMLAGATPFFLCILSMFGIGPFAF